jgi:deoxyribodipyrimidine photo-lyase
VDADIVVPSRLLQKEQYAARTIRPRIRAHLPTFLRPIRRHVSRHVWAPPRRLHALRPDLSLLDGFATDRSVSPVSRWRGGSHAARRALRRFVTERVAGYAEHRNHPERDSTSQLSPYLHFGHIGPHTVALAVRDADAPAADRDAFLEELIVRRELAVNFVRYNPAYDRLGNAERWAQRTLAAHHADPRPYR